MFLLISSNRMSFSSQDLPGRRSLRQPAPLEVNLTEFERIELLPLDVARKGPQVEVLGDFE